MVASGGIHARRIADTSFAIIDFETTGLSPGADRVLEISVVRLDPVPCSAPSALRGEGWGGGFSAYGVAGGRNSVAVADLEITEDELVTISEVLSRHQLKPEQIRVLHARAFASVINQFVSDQWLDDRERLKLQRFYRCLSVLGWAPGE